MQPDYNTAARILRDRILVLIPAHPEILTFETAWQVTEMPVFKHEDLDPTLAQTTWALFAAQDAWVKAHPNDTHSVTQQYTPNPRQRS